MTSQTKGRWRTRILLVASLAVALPAGAAPPARVLRERGRPHHQTASLNFDWDDNAMVMATRVYLRSKSGGPGLAMSTADYAIHKHALGKPGPYANYELDPTPGTGSFRDFGENGRENLFLRDMKRSMEGPGWRGPGWSDLVDALSTEDGARRTTIITAREHDPKSVQAGLRHLQRLGFIRYVPPAENVFTVNRQGFALDGVPVAGSNADRKVAVQKKLLDELSAAKLGKQARMLVDRDGHGRAALHIWSFSDDDHENYAGAVRALSAEVKAGRWPNVKIRISYTGTNDPAHPPGTVILTSDGGTRPERPDERDEHLALWSIRTAN